MGILIGTSAGVFTLDGRALLDDVDVAHVTQRNGDWWAVGRSGVLRSGEQLAEAPAGAKLNCIVVTEKTVYVGGGGARLFVLADGELVEDLAFAHAPGRDDWYTPWGGPPDVRSLSAGPEGTVYVNVHVGGILRLEDDGAPTPTLDINSDVHEVRAHPAQTGVVVAATARGLAVARDGHRFEFNKKGLEHTYCRAVAVRDGTVLISSSRGPRGGDARLHRGDLDGGHLETLDALGPFDGNIDTHCVAMTREGWFVGRGPAVWASTDSGATWDVAVGGLPKITCLA
ncbi:MAG TPA: hypothetical protein VFC82_07445 [Actinomycetaceae bacterium]|nr:hypothetical protein [Actinomycetaceae bacterium]